MRKNNRIAVVLLFFILLSSCVSALNDDAALPEAIESTRLDLGTSALSAAAFDERSILEHATTGYRYIGDSMGVTDDAVWHIGSCTKAMTATVIGRLVDRGVLTFDLTIGEVFPDVIDSGYRDVTVAQLLRHRGGVTGAIYRDFPAVWERMWREYGDDPSVVRRRAVETILAEPPSRSPGTFTYSNAGIMVAAGMAEITSGRSWESLMREEVFTPLGLDSAGFGAADGENDPWPHRWENNTLVPVDPTEAGADNPPSLGPAGTVHLSLADWISFLQVFLGGGPRGFLEPATLQELLRVSDQSINGGTAAGWFIVDRAWAGGSALNHAGSNTMNYAVVWLAPEKSRGIVIATNGAPPETDTKIDRLAGWMVMRYIAP